MNINQTNHYQPEQAQQECLATGIRSLIQLYASELNFHELFNNEIVKCLNWEQLEIFLLNQLELHPESAVTEANHCYFETLKEVFEKSKKEDQ